MISTGRKKKIKSLRKFVRATSINYIHEKGNTVLKILRLKSLRNSKGMFKFKPYLIRWLNTKLKITKLGKRKS
jgi:hypothetical protein